MVVLVGVAAGDGDGLRGELLELDDIVFGFGPQFLSQVTPGRDVR